MTAFFFYINKFITSFCKKVLKFLLIPYEKNFSIYHKLKPKFRKSKSVFEPYHSKCTIH